MHEYPILTLSNTLDTIGYMPYDACRIENSDIQFYNRPATGYHVILMARTEALPPYRRGLHRHAIFEYRYGSPHSYPAPDETTSREQAVSWAIGAIADYWRLKERRIDARVYPFGGLIGDMRLVPRKPRRMVIEDYKPKEYTRTGKMLSPLIRFGTSTWTYEGW